MVARAQDGPALGIVPGDEGVYHPRAEVEAIEQHVHTKHEHGHGHSHSHGHGHDHSHGLVDRTFVDMDGDAPVAERRAAAATPRRLP